MKVQELIDTVRVGETTTLDVVADGAARKLVVEQRKLLGEAPRAPVRAESPARDHTFLTAESLRDYLVRYGSENTVVYADPKGQVIVAVLDERQEHGLELVRMTPEIHPQWAPWAELLESDALDSKEFAAFLMKNHRSVLGGRAVAHRLSQLRATVTVEVQRGRGKTAMNGLTVTTKIQGGTNQVDEVEIPETITVEVPLYVRTPPVKVEVDLCVEATGDGVVSVEASAANLAEARVAAFEGMVAVIAAGCAEKKATMTFGRPRHVDWKYLRELPPG